MIWNSLVSAQKQHIGKVAHRSGRTSGARKRKKGERRPSLITGYGAYSVWILRTNSGHTQEMDNKLVLIDKARSWQELQLALHFVQDGEFYSKLLSNDKQLLRFAWLALNSSFSYGPIPSWVGKRRDQTFLGGAVLHSLPNGQALTMHHFQGHTASVWEREGELSSILTTVFDCSLNPQQAEGSSQPSRENVCESNGLWRDFDLKPFPDRVRDFAYLDVLRNMSWAIRRIPKPLRTSSK